MIGRRLSHLFKHGWLSSIGRPIYNTLIELELFIIRNKDSCYDCRRVPIVDEQLTAIIKTFERPKTLQRLLASIKRYYPAMQIIVVDDSQLPSYSEGVTTLTMPYDSGVSAGRQLALENVVTPYVLLLDDDFVFYRGTDLAPAMRIMEEHTEIDIMGGAVVSLPSFKSGDYRLAKLHPTTAVSVLPEGSDIAGLPVFDKVANFYIAQTQRLKLVGWDGRIKRLDHADFFTRAKGVLTTVFNKNFKVLHVQTPFNQFYMSKRNEVASDRALLYKKYYVQEKTEP